MAPSLYNKPLAYKQTIAGFVTYRRQQMLIVGAYPNCLSLPGSGGSPIARVCSFLSAFLPREVALHLLPFYPSAGDFGFAPDTLDDVRADLGSWGDVVGCASVRPLIVDGIYNHVGMNHAWVRQFLSNPAAVSQLLHVYKVEGPEVGPISPRGQRVLRQYDVDGEKWFLWQTFSDHAVDVRLDNNVVLDQIDHHLVRLARCGVWGIRLDAVAYYAKAFGQRVRHNAGAYELAEKIADLARLRGLQVMAQIDCDADGIRYFAREGYEKIPINDFTFSAYLALTILSGDPAPLARHLNSDPHPRRILIRAPRTHDGILLRSGRLHPADCSALISYATKYNIPVRTNGGDPYELNCSGPYLYSAVVGRDRLNAILELTVAVTALSGGWCYLYLPFLMGCIPEAQGTAPSAVDMSDPRAANRIPISAAEVSNFESSGMLRRLKSLLPILSRIHAMREPSHPIEAAAPMDLAAGLLILRDRGAHVRLCANFNAHRSLPLPFRPAEVLWAQGADNYALAPLGYIIDQPIED